MAQVRITQALTDTIVQRARATVHPAIKRIEETRPNKPWGDYIYNTLFQDVLPIIKQVPPEWLDYTSGIRVYGIGSINCDIDFDLSAPMPWPMKFVHSDLASEVVTQALRINDIALINLTHHPAWDKLFDEIAAYRNRLNDARLRNDSFVEEVRSICKSFSTLAPALKAWPPLWDLLPDDVKTRHQQVPQNKRAATPELRADLAKLTAIITAAKLGV